MSTMLPCAYKHFCARQITLHIKCLEMIEKMTEEGASEEVLDALIAQANGMKATLDIMEASMNAKQIAMASEAAAKRAEKAAETQARQAAKAGRTSAPAPLTITTEAGPEGPAV